MSTDLNVNWRLNNFFVYMLIRKPYLLEFSFKFNEIKFTSLYTDHLTPQHGTKKVVVWTLFEQPSYIIFTKSDTNVRLLSLTALTSAFKLQQIFSLS
jgi:hypothetical protein